MIDFKKIQDKWQKRWESAKIFEVKESKKPKFYCLEMFPYPSASGLHIGHAFNYTIGDIYARLKRMQGFNVLYPMGYDSLGLPAENAAIKAGAHPKKYTENSIKNFIKQQKSIGLSYDWTRLVKTHDPNYYRWDQWIFLKMFEKGIAFRKKAPVNWCPKCNSVLANEQVHNGKCWRHTDTDVEIKHLEQWFFKITDYADELYEMVDNLNEWPERIKAMQKNWIGKSHGTEILFEINGEKWPIFTTRSDTLFGVTFMVISAQHPRLMELVTGKQKKEVEKFLKKIKSTSEKDAEELEKEGAFTGSYAINPMTGDKVPVYTGNFVVAEYGSGMVMAVPAHDQRDFEFAKKYGIDIKVVIQPDAYELKADKMARAYTADGVLVNSGDFDGENNRDAIESITKALEKKKLGKATVNFKLRDWLVSRQRYWGTPIPMIYCEKCGIVPVPEKDLPVELPDKVKFGEGNPLETNEKFVDVRCPKCKSKARRETDTMDTFVNSSWYFLRYTDANNTKKIFDINKANYWTPVDTYIGGAEHACMHLIYFRFYTKFFRDIGMLKFDEPVKMLFNQGMIHGEDGHVMSKSRGNVVDPLEIVNKYGADALRLFLVSVAGPDKDFAWSNTGLEASWKWLQKVAAYADDFEPGKMDELNVSKFHRLVKLYSEYINDFKYNLAVIKLKELLTVIEQGCDKKSFSIFVKLLSPLCPHLAEEFWEKLGNKSFLSLEKWPKADVSRIDVKAEFIDAMLENTISDLRSVLKLTKIDKPKTIKLIVAREWLYDFFKVFKEKFKDIKNGNELIKSFMSGEMRVYGKEISKIIPRLMKDMSKIPILVLDQTTEYNELKKYASKFEKEFNCDIEILKAEDSKDSKAGQAMPGKPAILVG
ncbi:leucine--tRNA ligase [Candidatus Woesearchaeota archaeon]|nr:leucine--tRNA ligase [Candidatus Woesearchaeota archaeon]